MKQICIGLGVLGSLGIYNIFIVPLVFSEYAGGGMNWSRVVGAGVAGSLGVLIGHIIYRVVSKNKES